MRVIYNEMDKNVLKNNFRLRFYHYFFKVYIFM